MVVSHLNKYIDYLETREIEAEDIGEETDIYEMEIFNQNHYIALGKAKYTFATKFDVVYFPIYLLKGFKKIRGKIGVFEIEKNRVISIKDNFIGLGKPLFFDITTEQYLEKTMSKLKTQEGEELEEKRENKEKEKEENKEDDIFSLQNVNKNLGEKEEENKNKKNKITLKDVFVVDKIPPNNPTLIEETEEESKRLREEYLKYKSTKDNWIQSTIQNKLFDIQRNEGGGNCFFATIRDAFLDIGYHTSVEKLRLFLSQEVNGTVFKQYHDIYHDINRDMETNKYELDKITTTNKRLKKQAEKSGQSKEQMGELVSAAKNLQKEYSELKRQVKMQEHLLNDFVFMKYVKTIDDFKKYICTSDFWADTWAISTLELLLNIKVIILEKSTDKDAIMQCGQLNTDISTFSPKHYIIVNYTNGNHYELIRYKKKGLFTFSEIPYVIKVLIINKCMERAAGPYSIIQDFDDFKKRLGISGENEEGEEDEEKELEKDLELDENLYDDDIVFVFHNRSDSTKTPGKGTGEKIPNQKIPDYATLAEEPKWRQKIEDDWSSVFTLDHYRWHSVSHYMLALVFKDTEPDIYKEFSLDGKDTNLSENIEVARDSIDKIKGKEGRFYSTYKSVSKSGKLGIEQIEEARKNALMAKFQQNADLGTVLRNTKKAKLIHFYRRSPGKVDISLMEVRKKV